MAFGLHDGGDGDEYRGVDFVLISKIFVTKDAFLFGTEPFDEVGLTTLDHRRVYEWADIRLLCVHRPIKSGNRMEKSLECKLIGVMLTLSASRSCCYQMLFWA